MVVTGKVYKYKARETLQSEPRVDQLKYNLLYLHFDRLRPLVLYNTMLIALRISRVDTMPQLFSSNALKLATNLSVNSELLLKSRALKINFSANLEGALKVELAKTATNNWRTDNQAAIRAYNEFVDVHGCFGDEYRTF
ncbi:MAG: type II toxin-antitoxin system CcdA family antitoxin [Pseudomonadales bacterium]